ncbi:MAG TPA: glycosyltransferase family 87 protein [Vicinamibacterales bacterium]|nr:glycosyltransferase family 87 protein [Vicinamibacterales bacterium]
MPSPLRGGLRRRILLVVLAAIAFAAVFTTRVSRKMPDFEVYRTAGARAATAAPLYRATDGHYQFKYLPAFALAARPLAAMPLNAAKAVWFAGSAVLVIVLLWTSLLALPNRRTAAPLLAALTFLAMAKFYAHELVLGQVNLLFATIVLAAVLLLRGRAGSQIGAGLLFGAAVIVKPYGLLFAPWLLSRRSVPAIAGMTAGLAVALLAPSLVYGWSGNVAQLSAWWQTVSNSTAPNLTNQDNISIAAMGVKWLGTAPPAQIFTVAVSLAVLGATTVAMIARPAVRAPDYLEASLLLLLIPLLSPQGWDYVLLIATPAVMLLIDRVRALPPTWRLVVVAAVAIPALSVYDLMGREGYARFMALSAITICALGQLAGLLTLRLRRLA